MSFSLNKICFYARLNLASLANGQNENAVAIVIGIAEVRSLAKFLILQKRRPRMQSFMLTSLVSSFFSLMMIALATTGCVPQQTSNADWPPCNYLTDYPSTYQYHAGRQLACGEITQDEFCKLILPQFNPNTYSIYAQNTTVAQKKICTDIYGSGLTCANQYYVPFNDSVGTYYYDVTYITPSSNSEIVAASFIAAQFTANNTQATLVNLSVNERDRGDELKTCPSAWTSVTGRFQLTNTPTTSSPIGTSFTARLTTNNYLLPNKEYAMRLEFQDQTTKNQQYFIFKFKTAPQ
jgi:hypothetical protein